MSDHKRVCTCSNVTRRLSRSEDHFVRLTNMSEYLDVRNHFAGKNVVKRTLGLRNLKINGAQRLLLKGYILLQLLGLVQEHSILQLDIVVGVLVRTNRCQRSLLTRTIFIHIGDFITNIHNPVPSSQIFISIRYNRVFRRPNPR